MAAHKGVQSWGRAVYPRRQGAAKKIDGRHLKLVDKSTGLVGARFIHTYRQLDQVMSRGDLVGIVRNGRGLFFLVLLACSSSSTPPGPLEPEENSSSFLGLEILAHPVGWERGFGV